MGEMPRRGAGRGREVSSTGAGGGRQAEAVLCETLAGFGAWTETLRCASSGHQYAAFLFLPQRSTRAQGVRSEPEWGRKAAQRELAAWLGSPSLAQEGRFEPMSLRYRKTTGAAQDQAHLACGGHSFLGVCTVATWEGAPQGRGPASQSPPRPLCLLFLRQGSSCASQSSSATWASSRTGSRRCCWSMATTVSKPWRSW